MKVSAQYAQEHFADILSAAYNGEVVGIARPGKPTLHLIVSSPGTQGRRSRRELFGVWRERSLFPPD